MKIRKLSVNLAYHEIEKMNRKKREKGRKKMHKKGKRTCTQVRFEQTKRTAVARKESQADCGRIPHGQLLLSDA